MFTLFVTKFYILREKIRQNIVATYIVFISDMKIEQQNSEISTFVSFEVLAFFLYNSKVLKNGKWSNAKEL